jgi:hypothetical protein
LLSSNPEGRATLASLNTDLTVLNLSGREWADRMKRLAARAPSLDIFGHGLLVIYGVVAGGAQACNGADSFPVWSNSAAQFSMLRNSDRMAVGTALRVDSDLPRTHGKSFCSAAAVAASFDPESHIKSQADSSIT